MRVNALIRARMIALPTLALPTLLALLAVGSQAASASNRAGESGLLALPDARQPAPGSVTLGGHYADPLRDYTLGWQLTERLHMGLRFTDRDPAAGTLERYSDTQLNLGYRLFDENRYWPAVVVGVRDLGNESLHSAEYLVASKRWHAFDLTLGLGWGALGRRADVDSPLGWISGHFDDRAAPGADPFQLDQLFRGPMALFAGLAYQTPWQPLELLLEFEGNNYRHGSGQQLDPDSRFNVGARLAVTEAFHVRAGWDRGDTASIGLSYRFDLQQSSRAPQQTPKPTPADTANWAQTARTLERDAGLHVRRISRDQDRLHLEVAPERYRALPDSERAATPILADASPEEISSYHYHWSHYGMTLRSNVHRRDAAEDATAPEADASALREHRFSAHSHDRLARPRGETLVATPAQRFSWSLRPKLLQAFGSPQGYPWALWLQAHGEYFLADSAWTTAALGLRIADDIDAPATLPEHGLEPVRRDRARYVGAERLGLDRLQYNQTLRLTNDWFAQGYLGLLETMYGGAGGEVLYRPLGGTWALGIDVNWVRQRDFDRRLEFRDYDTWTGHITSYLDTGVENLVTQISYGRFLAGDYGFTVDVSRRFDSGTRLGFWSTWSNADDDHIQYGLRLSVPFDALFRQPSREHAEVAWQPLQQDAGARLQRAHRLYDMTTERERGRYWQTFERAWPQR